MSLPYWEGTWAASQIPNAPTVRSLCARIIIVCLVAFFFLGSEMTLNLPFLSLQPKKEGNSSMGEGVTGF